MNSKLAKLAASVFVNPKCLPEFMEVYGQNLSE